MADEDLSPELCRLSWTVSRCRPSRSATRWISGGRIRVAFGGAVGGRGAGRDAVGRSGGVDDPRGLVEQVLESSRHHRAPRSRSDPGPSGAGERRHVDAIIAVSQFAGLMPIGTQSASEAQIANDALRPLASRWCARRGSPRSPRYHRPGFGPVGRPAAAAAALATHVGVQNRPLTLDPQPGTGSAPTTLAGSRARRAASSSRSLRERANRRAGRWVSTPGERDARGVRLLGSSLSRSQTTSMWSATKPTGQTMTALPAGQRRKVIGDIGFQPRDLRGPSGTATPGRSRGSPPPRRSVRRRSHLARIEIHPQRSPRRAAGSNAR